MNSEYAHKREPKKGISVRLDADHRAFVEKYYYNKSDFYVTAIVAAIENHPKWKEYIK